MSERYVVLCRDDTPGKTRGKYRAAVELLLTAEGAAQWAAAVPPSRAPRIVTATEYLLVCGFNLEESWR